MRYLPKRTCSPTRVQTSGGKELDAVVVYPDILVDCGLGDTVQKVADRSESKETWWSMNLAVLLVSSRLAHGKHETRALEF